MVETPEVKGLTRHQVYTLLGCRTLKQYADMIERYREQKCPFCDPLDPEKNRVIATSSGWRMWMNPYPQKNLALHLIAAPVRHVGPDDPITVEDFASVGGLFVQAQHEFKFTGGGVVMRFGDPELNTGTVLHLHANFMVPDGKGEVRPPLAKESAELKDAVVRMATFEKLRNGALLESLSSEEREIVKGRI